MTIIIFVKSLEQQGQVLLDWVQVGLLDERSEVIDVEAAPVEFIDCSEGCVIIDLELVADPLSDQLNADFAVDESLDEDLQELTSWSLEVLCQIFLSSIEATTRLQQDGVLVGTWHETV